MIHRLIGLAIAGTVIACSSSGASSSTLSPLAPTADKVQAAAATTARVAFAITVPAKSQLAHNESLAKIAAATRSASLTVARQDGTPTSTTATVDCATACAGSVSVPLGSGKFVAKLFSAAGGTGRLLATGTTTQAISTQTQRIQLTFNPMVASVQLRLRDQVIAASAAGTTTQLLITARDPSGAVIVGPGSYVDRNGKPLTIAIANNSPGDTILAPAVFSKPLPSQGVSNVATITYTGHAHFHYPTFSVANPGLPTIPRGGVRLTYAPGSGGDFESLSGCIGSFPSVGGYYYGGPYFAVALTNCSIPLPATADIWRLTSRPPYITYNVNPHHDGVTLGFGSDKNVYFAYNSNGSNSPAEFGYLRHPFVRTSANVSSVSGLGLGNDGSLWFSGVWNGAATIGKLPPAGSCCWTPRLFSVPNAQAVFSIEPGIGNTEALLYSAPGGIYLGTIRTDLSGFKSVRIFASSANPGFGDLLAAPDGTFYVSVADTNDSYSTVYKITGSGLLSPFCRNVERVFRLSDGTGVGFFRDDLANEFHSVVHVVPGAACSVIPVFPHETFGPYFDALGIDSTTEDWLFYSNPSGHRFGIY